MKNFAFVIASLLIMSVSACKQNNESVVNLAPKAFSDSIKNLNNKLIDIRTPKEFELGSLPNAVNIDAQSPSFADNMEWLDKTAPIYIYCASGNRTKEALNELKNLGFEKIYVLEGGLLAWKNASLPFTEIADKNVLALQDSEKVSPVEFEKLVQQHKHLVVDFKAEWCGPCKKISPILTKLEKQHNGKFVVYKIDTDKSTELARKLAINSIPHLMVFKEGKKVDDIIGFLNEEQLSKDILRHF